MLRHVRSNISKIYSQLLTQALKPSAEYLWRPIDLNLSLSLSFSFSFPVCAMAPCCAIRGTKATGRRTTAFPTTKRDEIANTPPSLPRSRATSTVGVLSARLNEFCGNAKRSCSLVYSSANMHVNVQECSGRVTTRTRVFFWPICRSCSMSMCLISTCWNTDGVLESRNRRSGRLFI